MAAKKEDNYTDEMHKSENIFVKFIKKHIVVLLLVLVIIGLFFYSMIRVNILERTHEEKTEKLITEHMAEIDSLVVSHMKLTVRTLTWAVRSELIRQNKEQVNHFFNDFIREPVVTKIKLIDPENYEIVLSTDKKDEGKVIDDKELYKVDELFTKIDSAEVKFINPVMGLDRILGILVIEIKR